MQGILVLSDGIETIEVPDLTDEVLPLEPELGQTDDASGTESPVEDPASDPAADTEYVTVQDYSGQLAAIEYQLSGLNTSVDLFLYGYIPVLVGVLVVVAIFSWVNNTFFR